MVTIDRKEREHPAGNFGALFEEFRKLNDFSQRMAAVMLGVDESTIARVEVGARPPLETQ